EEYEQSSSRKNTDPAREIGLELAYRMGRDVAGSRSLESTDPEATFAELVKKVTAEAGLEHSFLSEVEYSALSKSYHDTIRVFAFSLLAERPFVLVLRGTKDVFKAPAVVDVLSRPALKGIGYSGDPPPLDSAAESKKYGSFLDKVAEECSSTVS